MYMPTIDTTMMIYILLGVTVILIIWIIRLETRISKLLQGKNVDSIEDAIIKLNQDSKTLHAFRNDSIEYLKNIEARLKRSIQAVETIRYNPFKGTGSGGNQSFATALINEKGDGAVISSLYSRDHVAVFSKPIKKFVSEFEMTEEERSALKSAKDSLAYAAQKNTNEKQTS